MELIQKTVLRIMTTGTTTGCTGTCRVIIPDTGATYNFKLLLNQEIKNVGFFDAYPLSGITGTTITYVPYVVTGQCTSRLLELRKYSVTDVFANQYFGNGNYIVDGVDYSNSISGVSVVYFLGGIRYVDLLTGSTSGSTFSFTSLGYTNPNFINKPIYQDPNKENIISNPKISDDVFIVRQELSAFDGNYRLEFIKNLIDLETYAAGNFFNIVKNT
ncbi:MAG: hypothetical protein WC428_00325 [Candidatus Paceibacterota bacterium]